MQVKVVFSAALWSKPHILVLDEPTNYLDQDWLVALAGAIRDFKGAVVLISHRHEFVNPLASEYWFVNDCRMTRSGLRDKCSSANHHLQEEDRSSRRVVPSSMSSVGEAAGNDPDAAVGYVKVKVKKKKRTRRELKELEVRRRLRYIEWLNSPKGTPPAARYG
jgi:elongation factor 3